MDAKDIAAMPVENDIVSFLKAIQAGDIDVAGILADWLDERGDPRGKLLRRRWKRWQKEREKEIAITQAAATALAAPWLTILQDFAKLPGASIAGTVMAAVTDPVSKATNLFVLYLREKFPQESYEASDPTNSQAYKDS